VIDRRTLTAGALVATTVAGLLVAWFVSGWSDVTARQRATQGAPIAAAMAQQSELARQLHTELAGVLARESERPYFHYQNLMHDPRAGGSLNVTPSPLAGRPPEPLVLGYFQREVDGAISTPTINDDVPSLSEPTALAGNQEFRNEVIRSIAPAIELARPRVDIASLRIDTNSYIQNSNSSAIFKQQQDTKVPPPPVPVVADATSEVTITVSSLEWHTLPYAGAPALVASRTVDTPRGTLVQGFVIDRAKLHPGVATLAAGASEIAPGWGLTVAPLAGDLAAAAAAASAIARGFIIRFAIIGLVAAIAGALAVVLVARAEKLARERSQFAAAAAHELRTPLAGLQLYGDMLADGLGDPAKVRDYARRMSEEAARLGRVVSNVLGFSQLERGNLSVSPTPGSLVEALRDLASRAEPALDRAGAMLALDLPATLEARFDRDALARIVGNLLDNAEKYGRTAEDRTIDLAARATSDAVEVVVTDRGPGVARPTALFQPFSRGVSSIDGPAGLGLGLALSRSLAHAMGGELSYRAPATGGASFVLRLAPAAAEHEPTTVGADRRS